MRAKKRDRSRVVQICGIPRPLVELAPSRPVSNENMSLPVGGSRNPDAVAFSSACENFVICLNTLNYACAICRRLSAGFRGARGRRRLAEDDASRVWARSARGLVERADMGCDVKRGRKTERRYRAVRGARGSKGVAAAFLSNVIETTIKYERTTMNAPNNPKLFGSSMARPEN